MLPCIQLLISSNAVISSIFDVAFFEYIILPASIWTTTISRDHDSNSRIPLRAPFRLQISLGFFVDLPILISNSLERKIHSLRFIFCRFVHMHTNTHTIKIYLLIWIFLHEKCYFFILSLFSVYYSLSIGSCASSWDFSTMSHKNKKKHTTMKSTTFLPIVDFVVV